MEKEMKIINWEHKFFVHHRIVSAVKRVEFVSERMSYTVLRGRRVNIFIINLYMLRSKIEKAQWAEKKPQRVVAWVKQLQREFACCDYF